MSRGAVTLPTLCLLLGVACDRAGAPAQTARDEVASPSAAPRTDEAGAALPAADPTSPAAATPEIAGGAGTVAAPSATAAGSADAAAAESPARVTFHATSGDVVTTVEVADTPSERDRGLRERKSLEADHGMLYVFQDETDHPFWMDRTHLSLDLVFIGKHLEVVGIIESAAPLSTDHLTIGAPSLYVVEVNAGFARKHGVAKGTRVTLSGVPARAPL